MDYSKVASKEAIDTAIAALRANNIDAHYFETKQEVKDKIKELIPKGSEVMTMTSVTLKDLEIDEALMSDNYTNVRKKLTTMDRDTQGSEMNKLGAAPDYAVGSVHAVTQDGHVLIASSTGSQLPAYAYGAQNVIWVVGAQKVVKDVNEGIDRIYQYTLPLESERANKAYNITTGSNVNKLLIINKEVRPGRITLLFVNEAIGF